MHNWQNDDQIIFDRKDLNPLIRWWIDIDRVNFLLAVSLIFFGLIMVLSASPAIAHKISDDKLFFIKKQIVFVLIALFTIIFISFLDKQHIKIMSLFGIATCLILLVMVLFFGAEAKGAKRWIMLFGFNLQPSEFAKTFFVVFNALILQKLQDAKWTTKYGFSFALYCAVVLLLVLQPDIGMTLIVTALWMIQLFIFGLPMILIILCISVGIAGGVLAYFAMPHVTDRINKFLNFNEQNYQVMRSIDAYVNGGFFGTGPGNGIVKKYIPDAHTDFIFAVVGEEFGLIFCIFLMIIFMTIIGRVIFYIRGEGDLFTKLALAGLISQIALQFIVNIGVSVGVLPTKGMTMPFISYGGSSLIAISIGFGIILSLTKKKYDNKIDYGNIPLSSAIPINK